MKCSGAHAAVTNVRDSYNLLLLHARAEQYASHHGNHVAEMRDWTNEAFFHVAKVNIKIASPRWSPGLGHILREDISWPNPLHQHGAEIANQWRHEVSGLKRICTSDC